MTRAEAKTLMQTAHTKKYDGIVPLFTVRYACPGGYAVVSPVGANHGDDGLTQDVLDLWYVITDVESAIFGHPNYFGSLEGVVCAPLIVRSATIDQQVEELMRQSGLIC